MRDKQTKMCFLLLHFFSQYLRRQLTLDDLQFKVKLWCQKCVGVGLALRLDKAVCESWQSFCNERTKECRVWLWAAMKALCHSCVRLTVNGQKLSCCVRSGKLQITEEVWFSFQLASARTLEQFVDIFNSATRHARNGASKEETSTERERELELTEFTH